MADRHAFPATPPGAGLIQAGDIRAGAYFAYFRLKGRRLGGVYRRFLAEDRARTAAGGVPARLASILHHAAANAPYYSFLRELDTETDPVEALRQAPPLTKDIIRTRIGELCSSDLAKRRTYQQTSGGSTGEPVRLVQDLHFRDYDNAVQMLISSWTGWRPGDSEAIVSGSDRDILESTIGFPAAAANRLMRRTFFNAFRMPDAAMRDCLGALSRQRPKLIRGYAQAIDDLAAFAQREGIPVAPQHAIITSAGMLYPFMRERIEAVFGCRVFNQYGSREMSGMGGECGQGEGMHVPPWTNYLEVVDDDYTPVEPGVEGKLLVTSLCNYAMPLIRYDIGDRAILMPDDADPCPCGRIGQRLAHVAGRTVDTLVAPDGSRVSGSFFIHQLFYRDAVKGFQIVQQDPRLIVYRIVATEPLDSGDQEEIRQGTQAAMGAECEVAFDFVDEIEPSASGKHRYILREC